MNASPLRSLVARHACACRNSLRPPYAVRQLSSSARHHAGYRPPISGVGSAERLRRRNRPVGRIEPPINVEKVILFRRLFFAGFGLALCAIGLAVTRRMIANYDKPVLEGEEKGRRANGTSFDSPNVLGLPDTSLAEEAERIPTGTSTIPFFPRTVHLSAPGPPGSAVAANDAVEKDVEYQLLGLGIRTVSLFSIQVYVVGLYVAVSDIATLQERLIRTIDSIATTLVPGEKDKLRQMLLDPARGEELWNKILQDGGIRTAIRIVPTRNTDFMHMRDGFVRGITARSGHFATALQDQTFQDETFGQSLNDFKTVFGGGARKKIPYGETLYLTRDGKGAFGAFLEDKSGEKLWMGEVPDERVSRLLWLNYLAGKSVSSEEARKNVVEGCVDIVSRPVGTVAAQVV